MCLSATTPGVVPIRGLQREETSRSNTAQRLVPVRGRGHRQDFPDGPVLRGGVTPSLTPDLYTT